MTSLASPAMSVRHVTRDTALAAVRMAADALGVEPAELTASGYRRFRGHPARASTLPSEFTISLLFGGWHRALEYAEPRSQSSDVEDEVRDTLYGKRGRTSGR
jgi:hypothetical protein